MNNKTILCDGKNFIVKMGDQSYRFMPYYVKDLNITHNFNSDMEINVTLISNHCEMGDDIKISEETITNNIVEAVKKFGQENPRKLDI